MLRKITKKKRIKIKNIPKHKKIKKMYALPSCKVNANAVALPEVLLLFLMMQYTFIFIKMAIETYNFHEFIYDIKRVSVM